MHSDLNLKCNQNAIFNFFLPYFFSTIPKSKLIMSVGLDVVFLSQNFEGFRKIKKKHFAFVFSKIGISFFINFPKVPEPPRELKKNSAQNMIKYFQTLVTQIFWQTIAPSFNIQ